MILRSKRTAVLVCGGFGVLVCLALWFALLRPVSYQTLTLLDGSEVRFLGMTIGTNQWNPTASAWRRRITAYPKIAQLVLPRWPRSPAGTPDVAVTPQPSAALWFHCASPPLLEKLVIRCLNAAGEEIGPAYNVNFRSATNAALVHLWRTEPEKYREIRSVEVYSREMPITEQAVTVFRPISEMEIYPGTRLGRFAVVPP